MKRGFDVLRRGRKIGELFEGRGPFVSAAAFAGPHPRLRACAYVSQDSTSEAEVSTLVAGADAFDAAAQSLRAAGFELIAIEDPDRLAIELPSGPRRDALR
jgi:hypothetical protein